MFSRMMGLCAVALTLANRSAMGQQAPATRLDLDARQASIGLLHAHLVIPAVPGPLTVAYPKWIPGEHAPNGPLGQMVRLKFAVNGKRLAWRRDDLEMYEFHLNVPAGATQVEADLDFACLLGSEGFNSEVCSSHDQLVVNWWEVVLYSPALPNDQNPFIASIQLPDGWHYGTALQLDRENNGNVVFKSVSLKKLVDSPLIAGEHFVALPLGGQHPVRLDVTTESAASLDIPSDQRTHFRALVAEAEALFGGPRYDHYDLLLSLGDSIDHYTLEHFESSENRLPDHGLSDPRILRTTASMIPHEYAHSWNGKYRTPEGLNIRTYQDPMKGSLVWVYEGLTDYIGNILAARSGFWSEDQFRQSLAIDAAEMAYHTGRTWRPLQDTTIGVQMLYGSPNAWSSARRNADFYPESGLIWLEADTIIRQQSKGSRSLDDFCRLFYGAPNGENPKPYTFDDVAAALNQVLPFDWNGFFQSRLDSTSAEPPLGGIESSGWKLSYSTEKSELIEDMEQVHKIDLLWPEWQKWGFVDLRYSVGLLLAEDGTVLDSAPNMSGYNAGILPGMRVVEVNGTKFSLSGIEDSIRKSDSGTIPELTIVNGASTSRRRLEYHDGAKYPLLVRDPSRPDLLTKILTPHASPGPKVNGQ
jgi:predicted metalloprotease with PDZ domain